MTNQELIAELQKHPPEAEVRAWWDGLLWPVHYVHRRSSDDLVVLDVTGQSENDMLLHEVVAVIARAHKAGE